jgi:aminoglycoside phosphotransferase (APT) family kinase protein
MPQRVDRCRPASEGTPPPEAHVDERLVRGLLQDQHPDLAEHAVRPVGSGWDNAIFRLGDRLAVRLPRRRLAAPLIENEQIVLTRLAARLTLPAPVPVRLGRPGRGYPWRWTIAPWLAGEPADRVPVDADQARVLADFLRELHVAADSDAPVSRLRGVPLLERAGAVEDRLGRLVGALGPRGQLLRGLWEHAASTAWSGEPRWLHGDLRPGNVLVDDGAIAGIIDWGDITSGDPATDLAAVWMLIPTRPARRVALDAYGADEALARRARGWAIFFGITLLDANMLDDPLAASVGGQTIRRVLEDAS